MSKVSQVAALAAVALACLAVPASATVLDFEDLSSAPMFDSLPSSYAGIDWSANFWAYSNSQPPYAAHSGIVRVATNGNAAGDSSFSFAHDVTFQGAWFAGNVSVSYELYDHGVLVHSSSGMGTSGTPGFLASGYSGAVDRVKIIGQDGQYVMDDVQFTSSVPEADTYAMMLAGLGMLGLVARRRRLSK